MSLLGATGVPPPLAQFQIYVELNMTRRLTTSLTTSLTMVVFALLTSDAVSSAEIQIKKGDGKAVVTIDGELFTEYVFEGHSKPILYPVLGPHGIPMTRNYPMKKDVDNEARDHPHHKSLWFTHDDVNGVQFWMEYPREGGPKPGQIIQKTMTINGNKIVTGNEWTAPDGKIVCTDERTVAFGANDLGRYIDIQVTMKASNGEVVIGDTKEGTMGIRTNPLLRLRSDAKRGNHTAVGKSINSEGVEGAAMWGKRAKWVNYWGPINDKTVGVAIFDHPTNPRHPTWWHARDYGLVAANPFGIHDFESKPKGTGDMTIKAGEQITFRYRFLFHHGDNKAADIEAQWSMFAK
jgi:hypothetical protein